MDVCAPKPRPCWVSLVLDLPGCPVACPVTVSRYGVPTGGLARLGV